jgi:hypothetical protein
MGNCKDCKWWSDVVATTIGDEQWRACLNEALMVTADERYYNILTGPNFGCVQFEGK